MFFIVTIIDCCSNLITIINPLMGSIGKNELVRGRFLRVPSALRRAGLDNVALVPASLLPFRARYQELANNLPKDSVLIILILPSSDRPPRKILQAVTALLKARGYQVTTLPMEWFG